MIFKRSNQTSLDIETYYQLEKAKIDLMYRIIYFQVILSYQLPEENKNVIYTQIFQQLTILTKEYPKNPEVHLQNYIIYNHLSQFIKQNYSIPDEILKDKSYKEYYNLLYKIYNQKQIQLNEENVKKNPLKLPFHKIVVLDYLEKKDPVEAKIYLKQLIQETIPFQMGISILSLFLLFSFFAGFFILIRFFSKTPVPFYGSFIRNYNYKITWILLESAVIYLFLYIPVNYIILEILENYIPDQLWFQIFYIIFIFVLVLIYFKNEVGIEFFKYSFWTKVYSHYDFYDVFKNYNFPEEDKENLTDSEDVQVKNIQKDFKSIIDRIVKEKKIKPISPLKEIFYGFLAFIVIFPISVVVLLLSIFFSGNQVGIDDAHPISFLISDHFFAVFILAVFLAPITEEIVFRNWIYGYFRRRFSILLSAFLSGMLFASLHPQGVIAYPYLVFLGMSLAFLREYRPGIIAPIITHACINGLAIVMNYLFYKFIAL
ncbi:MAG: hypothetical protein KatS3mg129_0160 [Leptospiraceae bacterium]|nr:MAG: hypothetical protein KatS3mg129_0160 [Leptospiraceae bacterium]